MRIIFFFVRLFKINSGTYLWFDRKRNEINLYTTERSGLYYLPTYYSKEVKYALFLANVHLVDKYNVKMPNTIFTLVDVETKEEFEKRGYLKN